MSYQDSTDRELYAKKIGIAGLEGIELYNVYKKELPKLIDREPDIAIGVMKYVLEHINKEDRPDVIVSFGELLKRDALEYAANEQEINLVKGIHDKYNNTVTSIEELAYVFLGEKESFTRTGDLRRDNTDLKVYIGSMAGIDVLADIGTLTYSEQRSIERTFTHSSVASDSMSGLLKSASRMSLELWRQYEGNGPDMDTAQKYDMLRRILDNPRIKVRFDELGKQRVIFAKNMQTVEATYRKDQSALGKLMKSAVNIGRYMKYAALPGTAVAAAHVMPANGGIFTYAGLVAATAVMGGTVQVLGNKISEVCSDAHSKMRRSRMRDSVLCSNLMLAGKLEGMSRDLKIFKECSEHIDDKRMVLKWCDKYIPEAEKKDADLSRLTVCNIAAYAARKAGSPLWVSSLASVSDMVARGIIACDLSGKSSGANYTAIADSYERMDELAKRDNCRQLRQDKKLCKTEIDMLIYKSGKYFGGQELNLTQIGRALCRLDRENNVKRDKESIIQWTICNLPELKEKLPGLTVKMSPKEITKKLENIRAGYAKENRNQGIECGK